MAINLRVLRNVGNFVTSAGTIGF